VSRHSSKSDGGRYPKKKQSGKKSYKKFLKLENKPRGYRCKIDKDGKVTRFTLLVRLDVKTVSVFGDKPSAKYAALSLGLKTWRYVKF